MPDYVPNPRLVEEVMAKLEVGLDRSAIVIQGNVKQELSGPKTNRKLGVVTGHLRRSIQIEKDGRLSRKIGTNVIYAKVHEFGALIRASAAKALHFVIGGKHITRKSVYIPPRPFLRPALKKSKQKVMEQFRNIL